MSKVEQLMNLSEIELNKGENTKLLGEGTMGPVYCFSHEDQLIALKCIHNSKLFKELAIQEKNVLDFHKAQNLIKCEGMKEIQIIHQNESYLSQVMFLKYYENNLNKLMHNNFNWEVFKYLFSDIIQTFCMFKLKGLFCSSLKPQNIFIEEDETKKFKCYFSRVCQQNEVNKLKEDLHENYEKIKSKYCHSGLAKYTPPELLQEFAENQKYSKVDPFECDIYSLGMIFFEWLSNAQNINTADSLHKAKLNSSQDEYNKLLNEFTINCGNQFENEQYAKIIKSMLTYIPSQRPTAFNILKDLINCNFASANQEYMELLFVMHMQNQYQSRKGSQNKYVYKRKCKCQDKNYQISFNEKNSSQIQMQIIELFGEKKIKNALIYFHALIHFVLFWNIILIKMNVIYKSQKNKLIFHLILMLLHQELINCQFIYLLIKLSQKRDLAL